LPYATHSIQEIFNATHYSLIWFSAQNDSLFIMRHFGGGSAHYCDFQQ